MYRGSVPSIVITTVDRVGRRYSRALIVMVSADIDIRSNRLQGRTRRSAPTSSIRRLGHRRNDALQNCNEPLQRLDLQRPQRADAKTRLRRLAEPAVDHVPLLLPRIV